MNAVLRRTFDVAGTVGGLVVCFVIWMGCAKPKLIPGTRILDNQKNRSIIKILEKYRYAMIKRDMGTLMAMAHPHYYEHGGTHLGKDDYGYKGLLGVIRKRITQVQTVRYSIKYRRLRWLSKTQVSVEIYIDASFQMKMSDKESKWTRYSDYNKIVLTRHKGRWLFLRGM